MDWHWCQWDKVKDSLINLKPGMHHQLCLLQHCREWKMSMLIKIHNFYYLKAVSICITSSGETHSPSFSLLALRKSASSLLSFYHHIFAFIYYWLQKVWLKYNICFFFVTVLLIWMVMPQRQRSTASLVLSDIKQIKLKLITESKFVGIKATTVEKPHFLVNLEHVIFLITFKRMLYNCLFIWFKKYLEIF